MSHTDRVVAALALSSAFLFACASPASPSIAACQSNEGCPVNSRCNASACVENSPPVARFTVTGDLQANAPVTLDASSSSDPDDGDSIAAYAWTITAAEPACSLPTMANAAQVTIRFGCAGVYQVSLSVLDEMHAESAPSTRTLEIAERSGSVLIEAGDDQAVEHTCSGDPVRCRPAGVVQLSATLRSPSFQSVRWTVIPPVGRELGTTRRVRFVPSETALDPTVEIETDGVAISGDWDFRVELLDGVGVLDAAVTRVTIGNRAPEITGGPTGSFVHQYTAASQSYRSAGNFPVQFSDPDGDPVESRRITEVRHPGDGDGLFQASFTDDHTVGFDVLVRGAAYLIGGAGLERTVTVAATDVNGASGSATFSVEIGDRPPYRTTAGTVTAPHTFDAVSWSFVSNVPLGSWHDYDGDPLAFEVAADADCPLASDDGTKLTLSCATSATPSSSLLTFIRPRTATVTVGDPWQSIHDVIRFSIANHPPTISATIPTQQPSITCTFVTPLSELSCELTRNWANLFAAYPVWVSNPAHDPDGDPLELQSGSATALCTATSCTFRLTVPEEKTCNLAPRAQTLSFTAFDGAATASGTIAVEPRCSR